MVHHPCWDLMDRVRMEERNVVMAVVGGVDALMSRWNGGHDDDHGHASHEQEMMQWMHH